MSCSCFVKNKSAMLVDERFLGVFFVIPCVDVYEKIDMRTGTYEIPPQEVRLIFSRIMNEDICISRF